LRPDRPGGDRDHRAQRQRNADKQHPDERYVRIGVSHAIEDCVFLE